MAIKSTFVADFSSFSQAVQGAQVKLREFEADAGKVGTALDRMGNRFSGQKIKQEAVLMGEAFKQLSEKGIKLTSDELAQMGTVADAAIAKFKVMGQAVPKDIQAVSDAAKDATKGWAGFVESFDPKKAVADPLGTAMEAVTAFADSFGVLGTVALGAVTGLTAAATAMFRLAEQSAGAGAKIQNLYEKTGITAPALSKLSQAATIAGEDVASIGNAIFMFDKQIADSPDKVAKGLSRIGLSIEEIQKLNPEEQFTRISGALAGMANVQTRNAAGAEIFGRAAKDLMPLIVNLNEAMERTNGLSVWTPEQAKQAEEFEMGLNALKLGAQEAALVIGKDLIPTLKILVDLANDNKGVIQDVIAGAQDATGLTALKEATRLLTEFLRLKKLANELPTVAAPAGMGGPQDDVAKGFKAGQEAAQEQVVAIQLLDTHLRKLKETVVPLTDAQQAQATAMLKGGDSAAVAARFMGVSEKAVTDFTEALKKSNDELKKTALQEYIANYKEVGPSLKSFEDHQKIAEGALDATTKAFGRQTNALITIGARYSSLHDDITGVDDVTGNLLATVTDLGTIGMPGLSDAMDRAGMSTKQAREELRKYREESASGWEEVQGVISSAATILSTQQDTLGNIARAWLLAADAAKHYTDATTLAGKASALIEGVGAVAKATAQGSTKSRVAAGAISGMELGTAILPGWGTAIGAGVGALVGWIRGRGQEVKAAVEEFNKYFTSSKDALEKTTAAYLKYGHTATEAQQDVQHALDATHKSAQAEAAALKIIQDKITLGAKSFDALTEAIGRYKFSTQELGSVLARQKLDEQAKQLLSDWSLLTAAGINVAAIGREMAASINQFQQDAVASGQEVDVALKPMLQKMKEMGLLTDAAGNKIEDFDAAGIHFSMTMSEGFKTVVDAVKEMTAAIKQALGIVDATADAVDKLGDAANSIPDNPFEHWDAPRASLPDGATQSFAGGGIVLPFPGGRRKGLVTAHTGEMVLTPEQQRAVRSGSSGGTIEITVYSLLDGRQVSKSVTRTQTRDLQTRRKLGAA